MSNPDIKLKQAYEAAEAKRRKVAITRDRDTIPMDFGAASRVEGQESSAKTKAKIALILEIMAVSPEIDWEKYDRHQSPNSQLPASSSQPDPLWKRYWKTEGVRALNADNTVITDAMERFRLAFELGYMACRRLEKKEEATLPVTGLDVPDYPEDGE